MGKVLIFLIVCLTTLQACQHNETGEQKKVARRTANDRKRMQVIPTDFSFKMKGLTNEIDSKISSYTRFYLKGDSTVAISFSEKELNQIYLSFYLNGIDTFPSTFDPDCRIIEFPLASERIEITHSGKKHIITYYPQEKDSTSTSGLSGDTVENQYPVRCDAATKEQIQRIERFARSIHQIVDNKAAVRNLPPTDMLFM